MTDYQVVTAKLKELNISYMIDDSRLMISPPRATPKIRLDIGQYKRTRYYDWRSEAFKQTLYFDRRTGRLVSDHLFNLPLLWS